MKSKQTSSQYFEKLSTIITSKQQASRPQLDERRGHRTLNQRSTDTLVPVVGYTFLHKAAQCNVACSHVVYDQYCVPTRRRLQNKAAFSSANIQQMGKDAKNLIWMNYSASHTLWICCSSSQIFLCICPFFSFHLKRHFFGFILRIIIFHNYAYYQRIFWQDFKH